MDIRSTVKAAMRERRMTAYQVAQRVAARGDASQASVYAWLAGRTDARSTTASSVLEVVGIRLVLEDGSQQD